MQIFDHNEPPTHIHNCILGKEEEDIINVGFVLIL